MSPLPNDPKLTTREVLFFLDKTRSEIDNILVSKEFDITLHNATVRLEKLRTWGCVKRYKKNPGMDRGGYTYEVTTWGHKCSDYWKKQEK